MPPVSSIETWIRQTEDSNLKARERPISLSSWVANKRKRTSPSISDREVQHIGCLERADSDFDESEEMEDPESTPRQQGGYRKRASQASGSPSKKSRSATSESSVNSNTPSTKFFPYQNLSEPVEICSFERKNIPISFGIRDLCDQTDDFIDGERLVSEGLLAELKAELPEQREYTKSSILATPKDRRLQVGSEPTLREINQIVTSARDCSGKEVPETAWNTHVHATCLQLAVSLSRHVKTVGSANVTTTRINPRFKVTADSNDASYTLSKLVDFVLFIRQSEILSKNLHKLHFESHWTRDFNHTKYNLLSTNPICVSIETKVEGEGHAAGRRQLGIWASSHFKRLESLIASIPELDRRTVKLPCLPLLFAPGGEWYYLIAERKEGSKTVLHDKIYIGNVKSAHGVLKVVAVLLLLLDWTEKYYRPWFEDLVTKMENEQGPPSVLAALDAASFESEVMTEA
ncbi:Hypothetical protein D9617_44g039040 [Elsinoe fawcettii]|nr:Hypothetical protein D9617_44g039040 [Elsinoe fawcettii]